MLRPQVRAAFGLFDLDDDGWLAGDRLEKILVDAGFRYGSCEDAR